MIYRGVDGRKIFMDDQDRARFVHDLYEFNDTAPAKAYTRVSSVHKNRSTLNVGHNMSDIRDRIVDLHGWKLMENHVHLLLSERVEQGLSLMLQKMRGYARYFNERHERHGILFDNTKKVHVEREAHFLYILHYVHLNGLDDVPSMRNWRERDKGFVRDINSAIEHLKQDRWSSFRDYCNIRNFPSILTKEFFESEEDVYETDLRAYLSARSVSTWDSGDLE